MKDQIIHWLKVVSGILAAGAGLGVLAHLIPGKYGYLAISLVGFCIAGEGLLNLIIRDVEDGTPLDQAIPALAKEATKTVDAIEQVEKAAKPFEPKG